MNELLKQILSLSLSGSLLILILRVSRPLIKNRFSKRWQYYIWLIVVARLLLSFAPEASLVGTLFRQLDHAAIETQASAQPKQAPSLLPETDSAPDQAGPTGGGHSEAKKPPAPSVLGMAAQNIGGVCLLAWLIVAIGLFIRKVTAYQSFVKYIRAGRIEITDLRLWERAGKLVEQTGIKKAVGLYTNSLISTPLLLGFFQPCIMLPTAELSDCDFQNTILHELTHYKRRDMFYKWLVQVTVCLHWFNPLVYLMSREVGRTCELSCDEAVIKSLNAEERRAYGDTLLNAMGTGGAYNDSLASATLNASVELLKERLGAIMNYKNGSTVTRLFTVVLTGIICLGATFSGAYAAVPSQTALPESMEISKPDAITAAQADEMALALTNKIWVWEWVAFFVPYMSDEGIEGILPAAQSAEWAGQADWTTGKPLEFTQGQVDSARQSKPQKSNLTKQDIDAHAKMIMQSNGRWDCIDFMLSYMTDSGIRQVEKIYAEKHGGQLPSGTSEPFNRSGAEAARSATEGFDYSVFNRIETLTPAEADALALNYIATTGQFGHVYNFRPYMTTAGIDAAVKAYLNAGGDPGVVLAMVPFMSEDAAKAVTKSNLYNE